MLHHGYHHNLFMTASYAHNQQKIATWDQLFLKKKKKRTAKYNLQSMLLTSLMLSGLPLRSCLFIVNTAFFTNSSSLNSTTLLNEANGDATWVNASTTYKNKSCFFEKNRVSYPHPYEGGITGVQESQKEGTKYS